MLDITVPITAKRIIILIKKRNLGRISKTAHWKNRPKKHPFFSIFNLTMTHESCINDKEKHDRVTQDLPDHLRTDPEKIVVPSLLS